MPAQLADLVERGLRLEVHGNPALAEVAELADQDRQLLVAYLRSQDDAIPQFEAKVLLVGEGNVGKTSLVARLA